MENFTEREKSVISKALLFLFLNQNREYTQFCIFLENCGWDDNAIENIDMNEIIDKVNGW